MDENQLRIVYAHIDEAKRLWNNPSALERFCGILRGYNVPLCRTPQSRVFDSLESAFDIGFVPAEHGRIVVHKEEEGVRISTNTDEVLLTAIHMSYHPDMIAWRFDFANLLLHQLKRREETGSPPALSSEKTGNYTVLIEPEAMMNLWDPKPDQNFKLPNFSETDREYWSRWVAACRERESKVALKRYR